MRTWAVTLAFAALGGCSHPGDENLGLSRGPSQAIDPAQLTKPAELVRAARLPGAELDGRLGARHVEASSTLKIEPPGKPVETLEETFRLDADGKGAVHLQHDNSRSGGLEAIATGGALYVRPRWGKIEKRRPEGDEVDRLRRSVETVAADYLDLLSRWLLVREDGRVQVAGRSAVKLKLSAMQKPLAAPAEQDPARAWRDRLQVRYVDGDLVMDVASGALLQARLDASYAFERKGESGPLQVTLGYRQTTGTAEPIVAPPDAVPAPQRTRPMLERQQLLEGLK
jgi:hypothetical protein